MVNRREQTMSAIDTFNWYVVSRLRDSKEDISDLVQSERQYLFTLRSEDERQRAVEEFVQRMSDTKFSQRGAGQK